MNKENTNIIIPAIGGAYVMPVDLLEVVQLMQSKVSAIPFARCHASIELERANFTASYVPDVRGITKDSGVRPAPDSDDVFFENEEPLYAVKLSFSDKSFSISVPEDHITPGVAVGYDLLWSGCESFSPLAKTMMQSAALEDVIAGSLDDTDDLKSTGEYEVVEVDDEQVGVWVTRREYVSIEQAEITQELDQGKASFSHNSEGMSP